MARAAAQHAPAERSEADASTASAARTTSTTARASSRLLTFSSMMTRQVAIAREHGGERRDADPCAAKRAMRRPGAK